MPKIALLLCLSISGVATPVFGQEASDEARFSMRAFNLRMSERMLTSTPPTSSGSSRRTLRHFKNRTGTFR